MSKMKVLIAEDERISARTLQRMVEDDGYEVTIVSDGNAAWKVALQDEPPSLMILDWMMPGMTGVELCRKLRSESDRTDIYIMILTAKSSHDDIVLAFESGADDYLTKPFNKGELLWRLRVAERNISLQKKLKQREQAVRSANRETQQVLAAISSILIGLDNEFCISRWNRSASDVFGISGQDVIGRPFFDSGIQWDWKEIVRHLSFEESPGDLSKQIDEFPYTRPDGSMGLLNIVVNRVIDDCDHAIGFLLLANDCTDRKKLENQLAQAQKLESIGQLAAGIAHEINTPIQFIGDNTNFLQGAFADLLGLFDDYEKIFLEARKQGAYPEFTQQIETAIREIELDYLMAEIPGAIEQSLSGIQRVARIVLAMKEFSHPGSDEKSLADINQAIESTLTVAKNEWKYIADVESRLDPDLPLVPCLSGELNQVILNLIINAAHAIADTLDPARNAKGTITIETAPAGDMVEIRISDSGPGIPEHIRDKIFDPFFTTKEVGRGTGQGLSIAHAVVVQKHNGSIEFETEEGRGTTFIIRLPISAAESQKEMIAP